MEDSPTPTTDAATVAQRVAAELEERGQPYALGGAIALGYWAAPRGTVDVDLTLFLSPDRPSECLWLLQEIGCHVSTSTALASLRENGYCQVTWGGLRVDVFLPTLPFYDQAQARLRQVMLGEQTINIWDAESLAVFKMMFFRRKDVADVEQILRGMGESFDRDWVRARLVEIYGDRDPRIVQWDELDEEIAV
jgi:hypothetical protein